MAKDDIYMVTTTFIATIDGRDVEYHEGEVVDGSDPGYKLVPQHFGPIVFKHARAEKPAEKPVEQATAAPGEKRGKAVSLSGLKGR